MAVTATNASCALRDTRKLPDDDCTSAEPPTVASGEAASMVTLTAPLATLPLIVGSAGTLLGDGGDPPPQPSTAPSDTSETASQAWMQNSRRDDLVVDMRASGATDVPEAPATGHCHLAQNPS